MWNSLTRNKKFMFPVTGKMKWCFTPGQVAIIPFNALPYSMYYWRSSQRVFTCAVTTKTVQDKV